MCRLVAHLGHTPILIDELVYRPDNSLVKQSKPAKDGRSGLNGDGFGLGWYAFDIDDQPGVFKSIQPAWNDRNLIHLASKIKTTCCVAHIRAATVGDVNRHNCHPFVLNQYLYAQNGTICSFDAMKRDLINELDDEHFARIKGQTDAELLFLLISQYMAKREHNMVQAVTDAIRWVTVHQEHAGEDALSRLNLVLTDGHEMIATHFASKNAKHLSLHYHTFPDTARPDAQALQISSEPLDPDTNNWTSMPKMSYLYCHLDKQILDIKPFAL